MFVSVRQDARKEYYFYCVETNNTMKKVIYYFAAILIALSFPQSVKADGEVDIILVNPSPDPEAQSLRQ